MIQELLIIEHSFTKGEKIYSNTKVLAFLFNRNAKSTLSLFMLIRKNIYSVLKECFVSYSVLFLIQTILSSKYFRRLIHRYIYINIFLSSISNDGMRLFI